MCICVLRYVHVSTVAQGSHRQILLTCGLGTKVGFSRRAHFCYSKSDQKLVGREVTTGVGWRHY